MCLKARDLGGMGWELGLDDHSADAPGQEGLGADHSAVSQPCHKKCVNPPNSD
jgi:hypothetical protein